MRREGILSKFSRKLLARHGESTTTKCRPRIPLQTPSKQDLQRLTRMCAIARFRLAPAREDSAVREATNS